MSVINQMLKDLDERQNPQVIDNAHASPIIPRTSNKTLLVIAILVIVTINVIGIFLWQLYSENQQLKSIHSPEVSHKNNQQAGQLVQSIDNAFRTENAEPKSNPIIKEVYQDQDLVAAEKVKNPENLSLRQGEADSGVSEKNSNTPVKALIETNRDTKSASFGQEAEKIARKVNVEHQGAGENGYHGVSKSSQPKPAETAPNNLPKLTISRKQLTPEQLVEQKIQQAERAVESNQLKKAEQLFEDVLLISPENQMARKKLAALWYGRQSYQAAHNLLSQGIALSPSDGDYRLMKARIYLSQGQVEFAVNALKALSNYQNVEYQTLLATSAQQAKQYLVAANAYQMLTELQPDVARWWLGLGVAYDSNSQFEQAVLAYKNVADRSGLSENALLFVRQRLQELEE